MTKTDFFVQTLTNLLKKQHKLPLVKNKIFAGILLWKSHSADRSVCVTVWI